MIIDSNKIETGGFNWILRCPTVQDAEELSVLRVVIDGETEYLDREAGEAYLSPEDFVTLIKEDLSDEKHLFLVAEAEGRIVGFTRCIGNPLRRFQHKAELGICILEEFCGQGIGKALLEHVLSWADSVGIEKISLSVVQTNIKAVHLYKNYGFVEEGLLIQDRKHKDGSYYNTLLMGRIRK